MGDLVDHGAVGVLALKLECVLAFGEVCRELTLEGTHSPHPLVDLEELRFQETVDVPAPSRAVGPEQRPYLVEREAKLLRLLDEANAIDGIRPEQSKTSPRPAETRKQPLPFVIANRVDAHACSRRNVADP